MAPFTHSGMDVAVRDGRARSYRRRAILPALVVLTLAALMVQGAAAGRQWCQNDPELVIGGQRVTVDISGGANALSAVTGPTQVVVTVPTGVDAELAATDNGFGYGTVVTVAQSDDLRVTRGVIQFHVAVFVPATDASLLVLVDVTPDGDGPLTPGHARGKANDWVLAH